MSRLILSSQPSILLPFSPFSPLLLLHAKFGIAEINMTYAPPINTSIGNNHTSSTGITIGNRHVAAAGAKGFTKRLNTPNIIIYVGIE